MNEIAIKNLRREKEILKLIKAVRDNNISSAIVDGWSCTIVPNPYSTVPLFGLYITKTNESWMGHTYSNSARTSAMVRLLKDLNDGTRYISPMEDGKTGLLMKNYDHPDTKMGGRPVGYSK